MAALTLVQAENINPGTVFRQGIIKTIVNNSAFAPFLPFINIDGATYSYAQDGSLPGVGFRGVNEARTATYGIVNPQSEQLKVHGSGISMDRALLTLYGQSQFANQITMHTRAIALSLDKYLIKGDDLSNPREFAGLQARIQSAQTINAGNTNGGDALSVDKLDEAIDLCWKPTHLIMNKEIRRRLTKACKSTSIAGTVNFTMTDFGKQIADYNGLPIIEIENDETETAILGFTETGSGGATATCTSIYVVNLSQEGIVGLRNGNLTVTQPVFVGDLTTANLLIEQYISMAILNGRAAVRIKGISSAAVVA